MSSAPDIDRHFVPLRVGDLVEALATRAGLAEGDRVPFRRFCELVQATYHFDQHKYLLKLKTAYAPYDPDADTHELQPLTDAQKQQRLNELFDEVAHLAKRANFRGMAKQDMDRALQERTTVGLNMEVDLGVFERQSVFVRGSTTVKRSRTRWWWPWSVVEEEVPVFQRLLLVMKLQQHPRLSKTADTTHVHVKAFKNIPRADLEMLFPGARVRFTQYDKGMISFPILIGMLTTLWTFFKPFILLGLAFLFSYFVSEQIAGMIRPGDTPQVPDAEWFWREALHTAALFSLAVLAFGSGYRAWFAYQHKKALYNLRLTESLYFQSIASNAGCFTWLLDEAEEQECREVILSYYFLLLEGNAAGGWTQPELDRRVEAFLQEKVGRYVDFEVDDAVGKLEKLEVVHKQGERYHAKPLADALVVLDEKWDNYFTYHNERQRQQGGTR